MFCRCPYCNKERQVSARQLRDSRGLLKCKRCGESFDALASLSEKTQDTHDKPAKPAALGLLQPSNRQAFGRWGVASLLMFVVLLAQVMYFDGQRLYSQPAIHLALQKACQTLGCQLPAINAPEEWAVSHSELQAHLHNRYWLIAALTNQAEIMQTFPKLKLTLTDFTGRPLAERVFLPRQYTQRTVLAADETLQIRLPLSMPAGDIGGFSLDTL